MFLTFRIKIFLPQTYVKFFICKEQYVGIIPNNTLINKNIIL